MKSGRNIFTEEEIEKLTVTQKRGKQKTTQILIEQKENGEFARNQEIAGDFKSAILTAEHNNQKENQSNDIGR